MMASTLTHQPDPAIPNIACPKCGLRMKTSIQRFLAALAISIAALPAAATTYSVDYTDMLTSYLSALRLALEITKERGNPRIAQDQHAGAPPK